jgi:hypothetical protein
MILISSPLVPSLPPSPSLSKAGGILPYLLRVLIDHLWVEGRADFFGGIWVLDVWIFVLIV